MLGDDGRGPLPLPNDENAKLRRAAVGSAAAAGAPGASRG